MIYFNRKNKNPSNDFPNILQHIICLFHQVNFTKRFFYPLSDIFLISVDKATLILICVSLNVVIFFVEYIMASASCLFWVNRTSYKPDLLFRYASRICLFILFLSTALGNLFFETEMSNWTGDAVGRSVCKYIIV